MKVNGVDYRTIWMEQTSVFMIEQNLLPFQFKIFEATDYRQSCMAIKTMIVRGAGAIGAAAGFAMAQAFLQAEKEEAPDFLLRAKTEIEATRPTARNLFYAVERVFAAGQISAENAVAEAQWIANKDADDSQAIGDFGMQLIANNARILTHCNAGWLAFVDYGTALSPIYKAHQAGKSIFVWADETRPRSQGARLTAWELLNENIPHKIVPDNAGAYLMQKGLVDIIITGADRIAANGDAANKIGTLEKAIVAKHYGIPFYIAAPCSTFDLNCKNGGDIIIEERDQAEVLFQTGPDAEGGLRTIRVANPESEALNPAFDVTPANLISGIITEKGIIKANVDAIRNFISPDS